MPYKVGKKGSYGCSGYPAVKDTGEVMGCHKTAKEAAGQIYAINRSEGNIGKAMTSFQEGDFVIVSCEDEVHVGRVEYVMTNGASGLPGSEYYLETSPDKPALVVRTLEFESDGQYWEETMYLVSVAASEATKIAPLPLDAEALMVDGQLVPEPDTMPTTDAYDNSVGKRDYSTASRERMAASGNAMPDGSFPIANETDLRNAIQSVGRAKDYAAAKKHIMSRAKELGLVDMLPQDWKNSVKSTIWGGTVLDLNGWIK